MPPGPPGVAPLLVGGAGVLVVLVVPVLLAVEDWAAVDVEPEE